MMSYLQSIDRAKIRLILIYACFGYILISILMMGTFGQIPYLTAASLALRWAIFSLFFLGLYAGSFIRHSNYQIKLISQWGTGPFRRALRLSFNVCLFIIFSLPMAFAWPNVVGAMTGLLPGARYEAAYNVVAVERHGGSTILRRYTSLTLQEGSGAPLYLRASPMYVEYPRIEAGDVIVVRGKKAAIGIYINEIRKL